VQHGGVQGRLSLQQVKFMAAAAAAADSQYSMPSEKHLLVSSYATKPTSPAMPTAKPSLAK
jgi:hypothetical protein